MVRSTFSTAFFALLFVSMLAVAQNTSSRIARLAPGLVRLDGTDKATGIEFTRFFLSARPAAAAATEPGPQHSLDFIVECMQIQDRRTLSFYLTLGPVEDLGFTPPFHRTPTHRSAPKNPSVTFKMIFDGYMRSKPFKTSWEKLPSGMYRYRNPSFRTPNLEDPRFFLQYLNSLPVLHIVPLKPMDGAPAELSFDTSALLKQISQAPLCQP